MDATLGQVVYSKAGRDSGRIFVITKLLDENYVYIADGDLRRTESPKRKKIKHLKLTQDSVQGLLIKFEQEQRVSNAELRKALAEYVQQVENQ